MPTTPRTARVEIAVPSGREIASEAVARDDDLVRGRATAIIDAPLDRVRATVLGFDSYSEFMPHYRVSKVLDRSANSVQVYMQVAALGGLVRMGAQVAFPKVPIQLDDWEEYPSTFGGGNVVDFSAVWRLRAVDPTHTLLSLEVFLLPRLPLPTGTLNGENTSGARDGVEAMRRRIEGT